MWKDILGFEGYYQINENGEVLNVKTGKLRSLRVKKNGYIDVDLYKNGEAQELGISKNTVSYYSKNPDKKMVRQPFRGFQIEIIGRVADMERSTTIL